MLPDLEHHLLADSLEEVNLGIGEQRFAKNEREKKGRQRRETRQVAGEDMIVYGDLDNIGLDELGPGDKRQEQQNQDDRPEL